MHINWYPGHMKKSLDEMQKQLRHIDIVLEMIDARIPVSSRNPLLTELVSGKPVILLINKFDLSDTQITKKWQEFFSKAKLDSIVINSKTEEGFSALEKKMNALLAEKNEKNREKGILKSTSRFMVVGIPNVGKSTFINKISQKKQQATGKRPGVTKKNQWIKTRFQMELLDTPGILWPKFQSDLQGRLLAYTGAIKDEVLDVENLAFYFLKDIYPMYPKFFEKRYGIQKNMDPLEMMNSIGKSRGKLLRGGEIDYFAVANLILDDYRNGKIGKMTLEWPDE